MYDTFDNNYQAGLIQEVVQLSLSPIRALALLFVSACLSKLAPGSSLLFLSTALLLWFKDSLDSARCAGFGHDQPPDLTSTACLYLIATAQVRPLAACTGR